jgi:hypothetical protein
MQAIPLRCYKDDCQRPWAHICNGAFLVESVHGGHRHTNAIALDVLLKLLQGSRMYKSKAEIVALLQALHLPIVEPVTVPVEQEHS